MKHAAIWVAAVAGIVIPLQGATFYYVVGVENRLTKLETTLTEREKRELAARHEARAR